MKYENAVRLKLEEKTLKIFYNDLKSIDNLDQKLKKLEKKTRFRTKTSDFSSLKSSDFNHKEDSEL